MPDDGHRYELVDGAVVVTPAPSLAEDTKLQPDALVARLADLTDRNLPTAPLLAVEVLSPSTRLIDVNLKRARYEAVGCPSYWTFDPDEIVLMVWELSGQAYHRVAEVTSDEVFWAALPFDVEVVPGALVR